MAAHSFGVSTRVKGVKMDSSTGESPSLQAHQMDTASACKSLFGLLLGPERCGACQDFDNHCGRVLLGALPSIPLLPGRIDVAGALFGTGLVNGHRVVMIS